MFARETAPNWRLVLVAMGSLAILLIVWRPAAPSQTLISRWQPQQMLTQPDQPQHVANPPPPAPINATAQPIAGSGAGFDLSVDDGLYADQREALADDLQKALAYVAQRFGSGPAGRFQASMVVDNGCGLHGIAYTDVHHVQTFTCNGIARSRAVAIMAHEFVHQLEQDRYGPAHLNADMILSEGTATWGAGDYWLGGQPDFRAYVRNQRAAGMFFPLATDYNGRGIGAMNALYYEWASFVDFLITTYGREKFDQVYMTGAGAPGSADYAGVYGKGLDELEREWISWLDS